jgi:hypothetical protein
MTTNNRLWRRQTVYCATIVPGKQVLSNENHQNLPPSGRISVFFTKKMISHHRTEPTHLRHTHFTPRIAASVFRQVRQTCKIFGNYGHTVYTVRKRDDCLLMADRLFAKHGNPRVCYRKIHSRRWHYSCFIRHEAPCCLVLSCLKKHHLGACIVKFVMYLELSWFVQGSLN